MAEGKEVSSQDEELEAGTVQKGDAYPKTMSGEGQQSKSESKRPPKGLIVDQFNGDTSDRNGGGWAVFEYPCPDDIEPNVEGVRHHVEQRVAKAGYTVVGDVVAYDSDDDNFRVAVRYM